MGSFFHLDDDSQKRIALEVGERIAPLLGATARWDAGDEKVAIAGKYLGFAVRVRLDATFGTIWFELRPEPLLPQLGQVHLAQDSGGQSGSPPDDDFEDPTCRSDFTYFITDTVHAGDNAPDAAFAIDIVERLPVELKNDLLAALEPKNSHFTAYSKEVIVRCGGEPLGEPDVDDTVQRYLALLVRMYVALAAIWQVE